jgi:hypothetical protein
MIKKKIMKLYSTIPILNKYNVVPILKPYGTKIGTALLQRLSVFI